MANCGGSPMLQRTFYVAMLLTWSINVVGAEQKPIVLDTAEQARWHQVMYEWNQSTLVGSYDKVGKKSPKWDQPAREALEATARNFSHAVDPCSKLEDIHSLSKKAIDAGCDDALILYLYARTSYVPNYPGPEEQTKRFAIAAAAMEKSDYPPFRRIAALIKCAQATGRPKNLTADAQKEVARLYDTALQLLPKSVEQDARNEQTENEWMGFSKDIVAGKLRLGLDRDAAFHEVDAQLAKIPELKLTRLQLKAEYLINSAWDARGTGFANTVSDEDFKLFHDRLSQSKTILEEAWTLRPNDYRTALMMLRVEKGIGKDRADMEKWFERAIKPIGNQKGACEAKLEWLDPKWHGTRDEMLAFGRACRDTKNWRSGVTLVVVDAHYKAAQQLRVEDRKAYYRTPEVWNDIHTVFDEYLAHNVENHGQRSRYAAFCYLCGKFPESNQQFKLLGDHLVFTTYFPEKTMTQIKEYVSKFDDPNGSKSPTPAKKAGKSPN